MQRPLGHRTLQRTPFTCRNNPTDYNLLMNGTFLIQAEQFIFIGLVAA
jgi:hypothetical protein